MPWVASTPLSPFPSDEVSGVGTTAPRESETTMNKTTDMTGADLLHAFGCLPKKGELGGCGSGPHPELTNCQLLARGLAGFRNDAVEGMLEVIESAALTLTNALREQCDRRIDPEEISATLWHRTVTAAEIYQRVAESWRHEHARLTARIAELEAAMSAREEAA